MLLEPRQGAGPCSSARRRAFSAEGLVVTRHEAISIDGERIPYVQTGPAGETGDAPVHMTGYGGFGLPSMPYYNSAIGKLWLERGGTSVTANIRGGGEFGTPWHDAGRGAGKRLSHDDFAAVAADLVRRGVTRPGRIAAEGGSNGGILITNMLTRYPERFGALFCTIPLIDMRRYSQAAGRRELDRRVRRSRQAGGVGVAADLLGLSPGRARPGLSADPDRHDAPRRPRPSRPCPQDGGQAAGHGLRQAYFYEPAGGRPRLRQGQQGTRRLLGAGLHVPQAEDRLVALSRLASMMSGRPAPFTSGSKPTIS